MTGILTRSVKVGDREISFETGKIAKQASGSVVVRCGDSMVLVTAVTAGHRADAHFFPMVVDYVEKQYAGGRIPGGFLKREARLSDHEVLTSRLIDRPIRPLFPEGFKGDTQITCTVLSHDNEIDTDLLAMTGASAALMLSPAPFAGPIAGIRVGRIGGELVANPTLSQYADCDINIIMAVTRDAIVMVEGEASEASEAEMLAALDFGFAAARPLLDAQIEMAARCGKPKQPYTPTPPDAALVARVHEVGEAPLREALSIVTKMERYAQMGVVKKDVKNALREEFPERDSEISAAFEAMKSTIAREWVLQDSKRIDGRGLKDIRRIDSEVGLLPRAHGSSLFTRGETQTIVAATLGTDRDGKLIEGLAGKRDEKFMLHYNFPPFSVGEIKMLRGPGRREIGHGFLAHKALQKVLPTYEDFPYVIRLVSEVLESNGSSSMASVCGGSLALMDAGVPISAPVAGIAMGLISDGSRHAILSDILGDEDHLGDMDFKVAGTERGITALQMDIKIQGLAREIMVSALEQARQGRLHILSRMAPTLAEARDDLSPYAPRIRTIQISSDRIRDVIGAGGKTIRSIQERTGCHIEVQDTGIVKIASNDMDKSNEAIEIIKALTASPVPGEIYLGTVAKITDFGAFITILPNVDGLCHISELSEERVERTEDVIREGEEIIVKCLAIEGGGKVRLSRKEALGQKPTVTALRA